MVGLGGLLVGLGVGAAVAYGFDPQSGRRRRALARDQGVRLWRLAREAAATTASDLRQRAQGFAATARRPLRSDTATDEVLVARVRAALGTVTRHPRAIEVTAAGGRVTLGGPVLADEVEAVRRTARGVRGVDAVEDRLEVHAEAGDVPALQGGAGAAPRGPRPDLLQRRWAPSTRLLVGLTGAALGVEGRRRRGALGLAAAASGLALVAGAVSNRGVRDVAETLRDPTDPR